MKPKQSAANTVTGNTVTGTISTVRTNRGYGFIRPRGGKPDEIFFHASDLVKGLDFDATLQELVVAFEVADTPKGKRARNVRPC